MDNIVIAGFALTGMLGAAAALVSLIVEMTKDAVPIPTQLWCILVSILVCVAVYIGYAQYMGWVVVWYFVLCAVVVAFVVAYIAMYGWDTFNNLLERFRK